MTEVPVGLVSVMVRLLAFIGGLPRGVPVATPPNAVELMFEMVRLLIRPWPETGIVIRVVVAPLWVAGARLPGENCVTSVMSALLTMKESPATAPAPKDRSKFH